MLLIASVRLGERPNSIFCTRTFSNDYWKNKIGTNYKHKKENIFNKVVEATLNN